MFVIRSALSYTLSEKASAWVKIDNATDVQYEEIEHYRMAGRNYMVGVHLQFWTNKGYAIEIDNWTFKMCKLSAIIQLKNKPYFNQGRLILFTP